MQHITSAVFRELFLQFFHFIQDSVQGYDCCGVAVSFVVFSQGHTRSSSRDVFVRPHSRQLIVCTCLHQPGKHKLRPCYALHNLGPNDVSCWNISHTSLTSGGRQWVLPEGNPERRPRVSAKCSLWTVAGTFSSFHDASLWVHMSIDSISPYISLRINAFQVVDERVMSISVQGEIV